MKHGDLREYVLERFKKGNRTFRFRAAPFVWLPRRFSRARSDDFLSSFRASCVDGFTETEIINLALGMARGLAHLHSQKVRQLHKVIGENATLSFHCHLHTNADCYVLL